MKIKSIVLALLFLNVIKLFAQPCYTFSGVVLDSTKTPIPSTIITAKYGKREAFAITNGFGKFSFKICLPNNEKAGLLSITIKQIGYKTFDTIVKQFESINNLGNIILYQNSQTLQEVIVATKPITTRGDTTSFTVSAFKNKLDENLEDVLKKMPGFDIDPYGKIKYNNKAIENILIEGDELTKNYKNISQNISPDMIEKVEVIDKYSKNPVLKNLNSSSQVAMNLVLKNPNKFVTFGNAKIGAGVEDKYSIAGNLFNINARLKSMAIANLNNIGRNPFQEIRTEQDEGVVADYEFEQSKTQDFITEDKFFDRSIFNQPQGNDLFNNSKMLVFNNNYKLNKFNNLKLFVDGYIDNINKLQTSYVNNLLEPSISYTENISRNFKPQSLNTNFEFTKLKNNERLLITGVNSLKQFNQSDNITAFSDIKSVLKSNFIRNALAVYYTKRIDSTKAIEFSTLYVSDKKEQSFNLNTSVERNIINSFKTKSQFENATNSINNFQIGVKYFFSKHKNRTNQLSFLSSYSNSSLNSETFFKDTSNGSISLSEFQNKNNLSFYQLKANYQTAYKIGKFNFSSSLGIVNTTTINDEKVNERKVKSNYLFLNPKISVVYILNSKSNFSISYSVNTEAPNIALQNNNFILSNYRTINNSLSIPAYLLANNFMAQFNYSNIENATSFIASINRFQLNKSQVNSFKFSQDFDINQTRLEDVPQTFDNIFLKFDKYFPNQKSTLILKNTLTWSNNPAEINFKVVSTKRFTYNSNTTFRTFAIKNLNVALGLNYTFKRDNFSGAVTYQTQYFSDFIASISTKLTFGTKLNYFKTNLYKNENYFLINANVFYNIVPKKVDLKFSIINLLNTNQFLGGYLNSFQERTDVTYIQPRFVLAELAIKL